MNWLEEHWGIAGGFAAGLIAWGKTAATVGNTSKDLEATKLRVTAIENAITDIKVSAARTEAFQEATAKSLDDLVTHLQSR